MGLFFDFAKMFRPKSRTLPPRPVRETPETTVTENIMDAPHVPHTDMGAVTDLTNNVQTVVSDADTPSLGDYTPNLGDYTPSEIGSSVTDIPWTTISGYGAGAVGAVLVFFLMVGCKDKRRRRRRMASQRESRSAFKTSAARQTRSNVPPTLTRMLSSAPLECREYNVMYQYVDVPERPVLKTPVFPKPVWSTQTTESDVIVEANEGSSLPATFALVFGIIILFIAAVAYCTRRFKTKSLDKMTLMTQTPRVIIAH